MTDHAESLAETVEDIRAQAHPGLTKGLVDEVLVLFRDGPDTDDGAFNTLNRLIQENAVSEEAQ